MNESEPETMRTNMAGEVVGEEEEGVEVEEVIEEEEEEVVMEEEVVEEEVVVEEVVEEDERGVSGQLTAQPTVDTSATTITTDEEYGDENTEDEGGFITTDDDDDEGGFMTTDDEDDGDGDGDGGDDDEAKKQRKKEKKKRKKDKKKRRKKKRKKEQPDGFHGQDIDMDEIKEQYRRREAARKQQEGGEKEVDDDDDEEEDDNTRASGASSGLRSRRLTMMGVNPFLHDDPSEMTYQRRLALYLMKKKWYNPQYDPESEARILRKSRRTLIDFDDEENEEDILSGYEKPSLAKAWAYFEHSTLQRHIVDASNEDEPRGLLRRLYAGYIKADRVLPRAEPGTTSHKTRLYDPIGTPHKQLGSFGQGIALYFSTLLAVAVLTFVAGCASIYSMVYFASDKYDSNPENNLPLLQRGSAVCNDTSWVLCPDCDCTVENNPEKFEAQKEWEAERCVMFPFPIDGYSNFSNFTLLNSTHGSLTFALKNNCDGAVWEAAGSNYAAVIIVYFGIMLIGVFMDKAEVYFDEVEQTAQDYSIVVKNPPPDANDPTEWKDYFKNNCDGAQVAVCTCAIDNDLFVRALVQRRETYRNLKQELPYGHSMDTLSLAHAAAEVERKRSPIQRIFSPLFSPGVPEFFSHLVVTNARVQALAQLKYKTTRVFVTFESEADQRSVLEKLTVGSVRAKKNDPSTLTDEKYLFRGERVLDVAEANEPNTVHWQSLNVKAMRKLRQRIIALALMGVAIYVSTLVIRKVNYVSTAGTALTISAFNKICPSIAKAITTIEQHANEGTRQKSLYFKIAAFRWINTVVVISLITPFTSYLEADGGLIPQVYAVFFSEIVTLSVVQICDFGGHFQRHFFAPRATSQDAMNLFFEGEGLDIAERYTNTAKIMFLALWYSALYPPSFFLCSIAMIVNYFLDRFSLMRTWKRSARLGAEMSIFSRKYFFGISNIVMAGFSAFYWSAFPYDNLCDTGQTVGTFDPNYSENFILQPELPVPWITKLLGNEESFLENIKNNVTLDAEVPVYSYCNQDFLSPDFFFTFPFLPKHQEKGQGEWMTPTQEQITTVFGWTSLAIILAVLLRIIYNWIQDVFEVRYGRYEAIGDDQGIKYSEIQNPSSYVPEVKSKLFSYPLLVCDIDTFDENLIEWKDPTRPYAFYDLTKDAESLMEGTNFVKDKCFSRVHMWRK